MNVLQLIRKFCYRTNLSPPTTVVGSVDNRVLQILNILEEEVTDLANRHPWQVLNHQTTHITIALEDQGNINTISPGFQFVRNSTIWDITDRLPVLGPISGIDWQTTKAILANGPRFQYRILGNKLLVNPIPAAGHVWKFEFQSKFAILDVDGVTQKEYFTADTDTFLLPDSLHLMGLRWRWNSSKGMEYGELFDTYESQVKDAMSRDGSKPILYSDRDRELRPGIFVPQGNWVV